jgi:hypothetical protein
MGVLGLIEEVLTDEDEDVPLPNRVSMSEDLA